jgi:hypothetical protein
VDKLIAEVERIRSLPDSDEQLREAILAAATMRAQMKDSTAWDFTGHELQEKLMRAAHVVLDDEAMQSRFADAGSSNQDLSSVWARTSSSAGRESFAVDASWARAMHQAKAPSAGRAIEAPTVSGRPTPRPCRPG